MNESSDGFLSRWARRKAQVQSGATERIDEVSPPVPAPTSAAGPPEGTPCSVGAATDSAPAIAASPDVPESAPLPTLADVAALTRDSDYARFVQPGVDAGVKNAALKKLFSDPHFNVMDGLDTYIDDYGRPDPIPSAMLRQMAQAKFLGLFDDEEPRNGGKIAHGAMIDTVPVACTDSRPANALAQSPPPEDADPPGRESVSRPDDDADLRLQQDDPAGRPGADRCPRP